MSEIYDIDMPTEPGLYESPSFPKGRGNPYRLTEDGEVFIERHDGTRAGGPYSLTVLRASGPYRRLDAEISVDADFDDGAEYWVTFKDDSRVRMKAREDARGDIDMGNDLFEVYFWSGRKGEPTNRDHIKSIHKINEGGA